MTVLSKYEQEQDIVIPQAFKAFYKKCSINVPSGLAGTDLVNENSDLKHWAADLLQENGVNFLLDEKDFVFMMHQGYMFWFFRADGNPNPDVYGYSEVDKEISNMGKLEDFLLRF